MSHVKWIFAAAAVLALSSAATAGVYNLKVVTDQNPDYTDMQSMIHSVTAKWPTMKEKCWAMWYWNHIARRQTTPMNLHGQDLTDPIMQFNDYGYTMCSTIAGINCGIWHHMGLPIKFWDIGSHTVPECFYDERWHMYDDSMSAIYTLCDGTTVAGVEDIGRENACEASGGKKEPGHVAKYHCLTATSPNGFLTGADCARALAFEAGCFKPKSCAYRYYYNSWDWGHRYILNLREGEVYTRSCTRLDHYDPNVINDAKLYKSDPRYFVPNPSVDGDVKDPEKVNLRFFIRGSGLWTFKPALTAGEYKKLIHSESNIAAAKPSGLQPAKAGRPGEVIFRVQSANVATGQNIKADFALRTADDSAKISVSTSNGMRWKEAWKSDKPGDVAANVELGAEVNGSYEILVKVDLSAKAAPGDALLKTLEIQTITQLNSKTQPRLNLGKNTVYVGAGEQTEAIVLWPELQGDRYKIDAVEAQNVVTDKKHEDWHAVIRSAKPGEDSWLVYRIDAPADMTSITMGARMYNRYEKSHIDFLYSLDAGKTWKKIYSLTDFKPPWDVIHYETADKLPRGTRSVLCKYLWNDPTGGPLVGGLYSVRIEAKYKPVDATFKPMEVTFAWTERNGEEWGKNLVHRSHTSLVEKVPFTYTINVGGDDTPVTESLSVNLAGVAHPPSGVQSPERRATGGVPPPVPQYGYSDGKDVGGGKFVGRWVTYGKNLATGKTYAVSAPSVKDYNASGDPEGKVLTDGIVGPCYLWSWSTGALWKPNTNPVITLDLGAENPVAAFGLNFMDMGDLLRGNIAARTKIEVLVSPDGNEFKSIGFLNTKLRWKDIAVNYMMPDDEEVGAFSFWLVPEKPVKTRFVRCNVTTGGFFCCTEVFALDSYESKPFDLRVALPGEK